jgi:hypothetical protein
VDVSPAAQRGEDLRPASDGGTEVNAATDRGAVPEVLADALARHARGGAGIAEVVMLLGDHRLLVPLLEVPADQLGDAGDDPCAGQDRAVGLVSVRTGSGSVGLAFTGVEPMRAWDPRARPMPFPAPRIAAALLAEGAVGLHVDPAGPLPLRLGHAALARLAQGTPWPPPWADPLVRDAVVEVLGPVLATGELGVRLEPGPQPGALGIGLRFAAARQDVAAERAGVVASRLAQSERLREVFDGVLAVRLAP